MNPFSQSEGSGPLVSVIIPVFNGQQYLSEAIDSVLDQTYSNLEIIAVDDGSTDESSRILISYGSRIRYLHQNNQGTASARNSGVHSANGSILAFLDQDDLWVRDKLKRQVEILKESAATQVVFGMVQQFISPEMSPAFRARIRCPAQAVSGYLPSVMLIRKEAFLEIGYFNSKWRLGEWADWYMRCTRSNLPKEIVPAVVAKRRLHSNNKGLVMAANRKEYIGVLRAGMHKSK